MDTSVAHLNGDPATAEELAPLAFAGYAHFTAMQVRRGQVRGLDLHLARLRLASVELFGRALPEDRLRSYLRAALEHAPSDVSLTATVYSSAGEFTATEVDVEPAVLIRTGPPASGPAGPLGLMAVEHERVLPTIKHVGEVAKTHSMRRAVRAGFDDAAFLDRRGRITEGSIWNLAFWDGDAVVWPAGEMLSGITMSIVRRQLDRLGVPQRTEDVTPADVPALAGGVVMNSWTPGVAIGRIGSGSLPEAPSFVELLHHAYREEPLTSP
jgi:branched-subunit amino acid aminotransferase/4-amino-4-deoxychorismate lyase